MSARAMGFLVPTLLCFLLVADEEERKSDAFVFPAGVCRTVADEEALGNERLALVSPVLINCNEIFVASGELAAGAAAAAVAAAAVTATTASAAGAGVEVAVELGAECVAFRFTEV